ncbi:MAG: KamA family radical SAM protein, partial [Bdellovibrionaceae bacterium]|nr:KamA family radical SAM protein [Pseudobdellovibrionaceae bacterium]
MKLRFEELRPRKSLATPPEQWLDWTWQARASLRTREDFARHFDLTAEETEGFAGEGSVFQIRCTPYYAALASPTDPRDPIRKILMPTRLELITGAQAILDPLGERRNNPAPRIIHRYPDRALFLVTDTCSVYCRYCTRKHFTGNDQAFVRSVDYDKALSYLKSRTGLREVILSGGDPFTLGDAILERVLSDLRSIEHIEIVRVGTRMPVVCPMRITPELVTLLRRHNPVYVMTHFNHPRELTGEAAQALTRLADAGLPLFNQMVLLNGVNNSPAIVQALSRRLLYLRVKPYYMHQCDPSEGTDHLRTSIEDSLEIQRALWGNLSGLAMPNLSIDIPDGAGKMGLAPNFEIARDGRTRTYIGWDGVRAEYVSPAPETIFKPIDAELYEAEWQTLQAAKKITPQNSRHTAS